MQSRVPGVITNFQAPLGQQLFRDYVRRDGYGWRDATFLRLSLRQKVHEAYE